MKILLINGDDDYAVVKFEDLNISPASVYEIVDQTNTKTWEFVDGCYAIAIELEGTVPKAFIEFLQGIKDHDSSKHSDWFIVEGTV